MPEIFDRAIGYLRRNGVRRSLRLLRKKATGIVPWNFRGPQYGTDYYLRDHARAIVSGGSAAPGPSLFGHVAIIGDLTLAQCKKFRVVQKVEALHALGIGCSFAHWQDVARATNLLQTASQVIFYRLADSPLFRSFLAEARRLGLPVLYDIDDPVFDEEVYGASRNLDFLNPGERRHLVSQCGAYLTAMKACDKLITSTPELRMLAERRAEKPAFVWRNGVDAEMRLAAAQVRVRRDDGTVTIGYASGSRAHEADFAQAEAAIVTVLAENPAVRFEAIGHLRLSPQLAAFGVRARVHPISDYSAYLARMAGFDISVVPLVQDRCNATKSAIRFLDAAVVAVPVIAAKTGDFVNAIEHGATGLLADGGEQWLPLLRQLVTDKGKRQGMGQAAHDQVMGVPLAAAIDPALATLLGAAP